MILPPQKRVAGPSSWGGGREYLDFFFLALGHPLAVRTKLRPVRDQEQFRLLLTLPPAQGYGSLKKPSENKIKT